MIYWNMTNWDTCKPLVAGFKTMANVGQMSFRVTGVK